MAELRPPPAGRKLILELRRELADAADPVRAQGQQAYMKSEMPFWGVKTPELRKIGRAAFRRYPLDGFEERLSPLSRREALKNVGAGL